MMATGGGDDSGDPLDSESRRSPLERTLVGLLARIGWTLWVAGAGLLVATLVGASGVPYPISLGMVVVGFVIDRGVKRLERRHGAAA